MQIQIPCFPISYKSTWEEIPEIVEEFSNHAMEVMENCPPLLLFEPHPDWPTYGQPPVISEAPEEMIIIATLQPIRDACFQALERVAEREPQVPSHAPTRISLKFKGNTPVKSFFRQMEEMAITVFSLTIPDDGPDAVSVFFLRTPFTVSEFRREISRPIE